MSFYSDPQTVFTKVLWFSTIACFFLGATDSPVRAAAPAPLEEPPLSSLLTASSDVSKMLIQQGVTDYEAGEFNRAIQQWEQALAHPYLQENLIYQAFILSNLSLAHQHLGQWNQAERSLNQSLKLLADHPQTSPDYQEILAKALNTQGQLQWSQGQSKIAYNTWIQAAHHYQIAGSLKGYLGSTMNQAKALQVLGLTSQAENLLQGVSQELQQQSDPTLKQQGLLSLGEVLRHMGKFKAAQEILEKALKMSQAPATAVPITLASIYLELANTKYALWKRAIALEQDTKEPEYLNQTLSHYQQAITTAPANSPIHLKAQLNQLNFLVSAGRTEEIQVLWPKLYRTLYSLKPNQSNILAQINLANSLIQYRHIYLLEHSASKGQGDKALEPTWPRLANLLNRARQQARQTGDKRLEAYALGELGRVYEYNQRWEDAQKLTQDAIILSDQVAALDLRYRWEWQIGRLLQERGKSEAAIKSYETAIQTLDQVRRDILVINSDAQFSLRDNVEPLYRELVELLLNEQRNDQIPQELLRKAINQIDALQLAELQDFLRCDLTIAVELSKQDVDSTAAIFYPIILKNQAVTILRLPGEDELKYSMTPISHSEVSDILKTLYQDLQQPFLHPRGKKLANHVYQWIIKPFHSDLEKSDIKTLVFILDGELRNIPPSTFYDGKRYLIEKYAISLSPGLDIIQPKRLDNQELNALSFGLSQTRPELEAHKNFQSLIYVETELEEIQKYISSYSFLNEEFTKENFENQLVRLPVPIVHLATHGQFSSDLEETFILAWNERLTLHELGQFLQNRSQNNNQPLELLVLSACQTASGDNRATLGLAGLAVRAGARSTLASLWPVDDASTALLMSTFYQLLGTQNNITKAEALRQAQLKLIQQGEFPREWSPYILVGNWL